jgi:hypothetical protein
MEAAKRVEQMTDLKTCGESFSQASRGGDRLLASWERQRVVCTSCIAMSCYVYVAFHLF